MWICKRAQPASYSQQLPSFSGKRILTVSKQVAITEQQNCCIICCVQDATGDLTVVNRSRCILLDPFGFYFHRQGRPGYDPSQCAAELQGWEYGTNDVM